MCEAMTDAGAETVNRAGKSERKPLRIKGLTIARRGDEEESVEKRSTVLELLATSGTVEVTRQRIEAGKHFFIYASDAWTGFELIYVLSGRLVLDDERGDVRVGPGDYLHHTGLPEKAYFRVEEDVELLMVSSPAGFHLMRDDMQDMMRMARTVEEKDEETEDHCTRIERLAVLTGERLGMFGQELIDLSYAAYLHDVGKIRVPDEILGKSSALSAGEWEIMKRHAEYGAEMLREKEFLGTAGKMVEAHHERYDGNGYPKGLKGEEIPLGARIIAVVDTYDAITSDRPYQSAHAKQEAVRELREHAGTQLDPRVVEAFLSLIERADDA
jgi:putative nucleotidyltransferase with HDIG domain